MYTYVNDAFNQQSTIDYSLCSDANKLINLQIVEPAINLSDHLPLLTILTACKANLFKGNVNDYDYFLLMSYILSDIAGIMLICQIITLIQVNNYKSCRASWMRLLIHLVNRYMTCPKQ